MAGEQRLRDAKITLKLDIQGAKDAMNKVPESQGGEGTGKSSPGNRPPAPGRDSDQKDEEQDRRDDRRKPRQSRRPPVGAVAAGRKGGGLVIGAVKTIAASVALSMVADIVPGMIDAKAKLLDDDQDGYKALLDFMQSTFGVTFAGLADLLRFVESAAPVIAAATNTSLAVARSNELMGLGLTSAQIGNVAFQQSAIASVETSLSLQRRKFGREALGGALVSSGEDLKDALSKAAVTNK